MTPSPGILWTVLFFALAIGPLIFVHEFGHYWVGRWFGVKADAFSIGFGGEVAGWTDKRGTRWKLGWLPLGGYVKFAGDMNPASQPDSDWLALPPEERARTFQAKPLWQRALIVASGPATNFLLAVVLLTGFFWANGEPRTPPVVAIVAAHSAAEAGGLRPGDRVLRVAGRAVESFEDIAGLIEMRPGEQIPVVIERGGHALTIATTPRVDIQRDRFGNEYRIGRLGIAATARVNVPVSLLAAPGVAVRETFGITRSIVDGLAQIVTGRRSVGELGGPLRIAKISGEVATVGVLPFLWLVALISINLGFINLLPVPMLDGGHLLFYGIEAVRRRPVEPKAQEWAFRTGLAALLALMIFVTVNDLGAFGLWNRLAGLIG